MTPAVRNFFDQIENVPVGHLRRYCFHNDAMVEIVEKPLDIGVE